MDKVLKKIKKLSNNKYAFTLDDKNNPYTVKTYIDTGCYVLNAVVGNGDIYSGMPLGKRITIAGPSSTAKSFFGAHMIKSYLDNVDNSYIIFFESEGSTISEMAKNLGIPPDRMIILPVMTVEEFKIQSVAILDGILEEKLEKKEDAPKYIMCLDSIGMLASEKETRDAQDGKNTVDMTRAKAVKSVFRLITMKLSLSETTLLTVAHTYQTMEMFSRAIVSGGTGLSYASDIILILSKAKQKDGTEHVGANITCNVEKSRYIPEGQKVKVQILFKRGMSKYSSLIDMAQDYGILEKEGNSYLLPDGEKVTMKKVKANPEKYVPQFLDSLRDEILKRFSFAASDEDVELTDFEDEDTPDDGDSEESVDMSEGSIAVPADIGTDDSPIGFNCDH